MSKITNDGLTWSGTGCYMPASIRQQWVSKVKGPYCASNATNSCLQADEIRQLNGLAYHVTDKQAK